MAQGAGFGGGGEVRGTRAVRTDTSLLFPLSYDIFLQTGRDEILTRQAAFAPKIGIMNKMMDFFKMKQNKGTCSVGGIHGALFYHSV